MVGVQTLRREQVENDFLRTRSFGGFGYSHLIPFFEGPFEEFFYVDADAVLLGDVLAVRAQHSADILTPFEFGVVSDAGLTSANWFLTDFIERKFPDFRWRGHGYFFAGTFFGKRGLLDIGEYERLMDLQRADPHGSFQCGDQGILNYLIFSGSADGRFSQASVDFQRLTGLVNHLQPGAYSAWGPSSSECAVLHYAHEKPWRSCIRPIAKALGIGAASRSISRPMNHYREAALREVNAGASSLSVSIALACEDLRDLWRRLRSGCRSRLRKVTRPPF